LLLGAAACGYDTSATFNSDGSVAIALKFLLPKTLMTPGPGVTVHGMSPADIAAANKQLQSRYPDGRITTITEGDEAGAMVTIPFKTEKDAFAFLTQPSQLNPSSAASGNTSINLGNTGGLFTSATHTTSGASDTYTFKTAAATMPSPSPGQQTITPDEVESMFILTFSLTVPHTISSAPGALFSLDRKTAVWKLHWAHAETLTATTGPDATLAGYAAGTPVEDYRLAIAVGFIAIAVGFVIGMFAQRRRAHPAAVPAPVPAAPAPPIPPPAPSEPVAWASPPDAPPPYSPPGR
jgi:hypothetical protein